MSLRGCCAKPSAEPKAEPRAEPRAEQASGQATRRGEVGHRLQSGVLQGGGGLAGRPGATRGGGRIADQEVSQTLEYLIWARTRHLAWPGYIDSIFKRKGRLRSNQWDVTLLENQCGWYPSQPFLPLYMPHRTAYTGRHGRSNQTKTGKRNHYKLVECF